MTLEVFSPSALLVALVGEQSRRRSLAEREMARRSLAAFVKQAWQVIEPSTPLIWDWPVQVICDHAQALIEDWLAAREIFTGPTHRARTLKVRRNLIINVPPGSMKSTIISVCLPAWVWLHCPQWRSIFASGSESVALRDSTKCRDIIESEWYKGFGYKWRMAKDQNAKGLFRNTTGGFRKAMPAGARITGDRVDGLFCDDPNDAQTVRSKLERDAISDGWWFPAAQNRLSNLSTGTRCIIQQRLHEADLTGAVLARARKNWDVLIIRQMWEPPKPRDPDYETSTSLGWVDPRTEPGELFFPERFTPADVEDERINLGPISFAGQHQQRPIPAEGALFKPERITIVDAIPVGTQFVRGWDLAGTLGGGDWTAGCKLGRMPSGRFIIAHVARIQTDDPRSFVHQTAAADGREVPFSISQDPGAAGKIQAADMVQFFSGFTLTTSPETGDKVTRAEPFSVQVNAGNVDMIRGEWNQELLDELRPFPLAKHDDQVDALSRAFAKLTQGGGGLLEMYRQQVRDEEEARTRGV